jgi:hypothetical protein
MIGSQDAFTPAIVAHIASAEPRMDRGTRQEMLRYTGGHFRTPGRLLCNPFAFRNSFPFRHKEKLAECSHLSASFV